jgi:diguanylate cyclase
MNNTDLAGGDGATVSLSPKNKQDIYRIAAEAMDLIHQHAALPDPISYAVWFAFAAKSDPALVETISKKLAKGQSLSPFDIAEIYKAFLQDDPAFAISQKIGSRFEDSLTAVSELIVEGSKNSESFRATLEVLGQRIPNLESAGEIDAIVSRLVVENEKMSHAMRVLDIGLAESQAQIDRLNAELEDLQKLSLRDPLTEVSNRRAFDACLAQAIEVSLTSHSPFCLAMTDIDHFKRVNDTLGHQSGDNVLKAFSEVLQRNTKGKDLVARCGGEEFAIILPQTSIVAAHNLMVKIASEVRQTRFLPKDDHDKIGKITASFGVCEYRPGLSAEELFDRADSKLYDAKRSGRDCVRSDLTP